MKSFNVSNFRLFGEDGAEIQFKPITVLTGANSSGKSSYVKALVVFGQYMDSILNDFKRDGSYNPIEQKLDFSDPKLKIKGFSSSLNRVLPKGTPMSFCIELIPSVSCFGGYKVTYSFVEDNLGKTLELGALQSISISISNEEVIRFEKSSNEALVVTKFNHNPVLTDFLAFCKYCYLPYHIIDTNTDIADPDFFDDDGQFSFDLAAKTPLGKRLAHIQGEEKASFDFARVIQNLPWDVRNEYKALFTLDLFKAIEKCDEFKLIYYFPVLERFVGASKQDSIKILKHECSPSASLCAIFATEKDVFQKKLDILINGFKESEFNSFIDFFRSLEDYVLANVNNKQVRFSRWGESYNFIEDGVMPFIGAGFDSLGFTKRDKNDTLFSIAYEVLSCWQWADGEKNDPKWMHDTKNGKEISEPWSTDDDIISREISWDQMYYRSSHILEKAYKDYVRIILFDCLLSQDLARLEYNTGSFATVQRLHSFEENSDFVKTIKEYLIGRSYLLKTKTRNKFIVGKDSLYVPDTFLNKWIGKQGLGICESIKVEQVEGLGFKIIMKKETGELEPLADMGHGITQMVSILLQIENCLIQNEIKDLERANTENGSAGKIIPAIIAIEEPEVSLHPCFQSRLAEIFQDAVENYGRLSFIIETHSEYLVRKMQAIVSSFSEDHYKNNPFAVYYFNTDGGLYSLGFTKTGRFDRSFGTGFFDESARSKYEIIRREEAEKNSNL